MFQNIDFNVAVTREGDEVQGGGGGTRRYLARTTNTTARSRMLRIVWIRLTFLCLGILYSRVLDRQISRGAYTPIKTQPADLKQFKGCALHLSSSLVNVLVKMVVPERKDRFQAG